MNVAVIGLGYVGLPLAIRLSQIGLTVTGIDINQNKIKSLSKGIIPFAQNEPHLLEYFRKELKKGKLLFSTQFKDAKDSEIIFINVDTPIIDISPNYNSLNGAIKSVGPFLKKGSIIVIESTVSPNTTKNLAIPALEKSSNLKINKDFYVATIPERIRPNHIFEQLTKLSRVIGISDPKIKKPLNELYTKITKGEIDFTDLTTAETVKTVENSFRDVNIAFANEVAIACEALGVNVWDVVRFVNKSPFHYMHNPGAGVGGHCIPKDPWLLISSVKQNNMNLLRTSRSINENMPEHLYHLMEKTLKEQGININNALIAVLGFSYVENSDDVRNSPTETLIQVLNRKKVKYKIHDPIVKNLKNTKLEKVIRNSDCLVLMVGHKNYKKINFKKISKLMRNKIIIDGRNFFDKEKAQSLGFIYKGVGNV